MAKAEVAEIQQAATIAGIPDVGFVWQTDHVEAARSVALDTEGDVYIGLLLELQWIDSLDEKRDERNRFFLQAKFEDPEGIAAINCGYELTNYFAPKGEIDTSKYGKVYRLQLMRKVDVDRQSPMNSFRVDVALPTANADNPA